MAHRRNCRVVTSAHPPFYFNYRLKTWDQHTRVHADLSWGWVGRDGGGEWRGGLSWCLFGHGSKPDGEVWLMVALGDIAQTRWMMRSAVLLGRELMLHWCPNAVSLPPAATPAAGRSWEWSTTCARLLTCRQEAWNANRVRAGTRAEVGRNTSALTVLLFRGSAGTEKHSVHPSIKCCCQWFTCV